MTDIVKLDNQTRQYLEASGTATIANLLLKRGFRNVYLLGIKPLIENQRPMVGPAYTLRFIPAREDLDTMANYARPDNIHRRAIEECPAGAVLVIDAMGSLKASSAGDMMAERLNAKGAAGIVTDGGFRDTPGIKAAGFPAYQQAAAPPATVIALHPVDLNVPIGCAGVAIYPGDIIVGDAEGVVAIPREHAEDVAREAYEATLYEDYAQQRIKNGESIFGIFPATEESQREYQQWRDAKADGAND